MSTCISTHGEFSEHRPDDAYVCELCGVLDEDGLLSELRRLRAMTTNPTAQSAPTPAPVEHRPEPVTAPLPSEAVDEDVLVRRTLVALTEQRVVDSAKYGEAPYAPWTVEGVREYLGLVLEDDEDTVRVPCGCGYSGFGGGHRDTCPAKDSTR